MNKEQTAKYVIEGITDNWPDASGALGCTGWRYADRKFSFQDYEDGKKYAVGMPELLKAFDLLFTDKWPKGCTRPCHIGAREEVWEDWLCQADATDFDAFAQLACLGEVIYG